MFTLCYAYPIILFLKRNTFHSRWKSCRGVQVSVLKAVPVSYVIHIKVTPARISKTKTNAYVSATDMKFINLGGVAGGEKVPNLEGYAHFLVFEGSNSKRDTPQVPLL